MDKVNIPVIALDSKAAAAALGISLSLFYQLDAEGKIPMGQKIHSKKMYSVRQLKLWADNSMPCRTSPEWQSILERTRNENPSVV